MARFILSSFADESASDLKDQLRISAKNGIQYVEMRNVDGQPLVDMNASQVKRIKEELKAQGFKLSAVGSPFGKIGITDDFTAHLEKFKRCVEIANELETGFIRMFSFYTPEGEDPTVYRDEVMERLQKFVDVLDGSGVRCCHENEKGIFGNVPERCADILKTFEGRIAGIFDPANFIQESCETLPAYEMLEPYIEYMHIKDALLKDGSVTPAGKGDGSIPEILKRFAQKPGDRFLTVEPHLKIFEGFAGLEKDGVVPSRSGYVYDSSEEAYGAAVDSLKSILNDLGYSEDKKGGVTVWKK